MPRGKKDEIEGEINDEAGRLERQAGEWSGDSKEQLRGVKLQAQGKGQKVLGKVKNQASRLQSPIKKRPGDKAA